MPDEEPVPILTNRHILHLPKARLNGNGVVKKPDGEVRRDEIMAEQGIKPIEKEE